MEHSDDGDTLNPDRDDLSLPEEELKRLRVLMEKMLSMGIFAVYGEEENKPEVLGPDCASLLPTCKARCCTLHFALTKGEVQKGRIRHDPARPFFISRDQDGYCPHLDRASLRCTVWEDRPARCRNYDCREGAEALSSPAETTS